MMSKKDKIYLYYNEDETGGNISEGYEDSEWPSHEPLYRSFHVLGLSRTIKKNDWIEQIEVDFDPKEVNDVWVVIVRYQSGDSFGSSYGNWHIEGAYKAEGKAIFIKKSIENGTYKGWYKPWIGYFEGLESVEVVKMNLVDEYIRN